jgi:hypothetical protein
MEDHNPEPAPMAMAPPPSQPVATTYAAITNMPPNTTSPMDYDYLPLEPSSRPSQWRGEVPFHSLLASGQHKLPSLHYSIVDQTVRSGHLVKQAKINESQGIVSPHSKLLTSYCGFPTNEDEWNTLVS